MILAGHQFNERDLIGRVMRNAKPVRSKGSGTYRWSWVCDRFGVGSTVAAALCKEFGLDPDEMVHK